MRPFVAIAGLAFFTCLSAQTREPLAIDQNAYLADVMFLSSDEMRGRASGTDESERAASYIAGAMKEAGLEPAGDGDSYFQVFPLPGSERTTARNVIGILRGHNKSCTTGVVIGAHYDHVGMGRAHSMAPQGAGEIHNGADDNASGTAAVMQMARTAVANRARFACSVIFIAFGAEEIGLVGSRHYVTRPAIAMRQTKAMINLDMIGRANGRVMIGRGEQLKALLGELQSVTSLKLDDFREGYGDGASDDTPFRKAGVTAVAFFTGFHDDYHRPTDDWQQIDVAGAAEVAKLALTVAEKLACC